MTIEYLGHSTFIFYTIHGNILLDPFIKGNPLATKEISDIQKIDWIFLSHGHDDHISDTLEFSKKWQSPIICTPEIAHFLSIKGALCLSSNIGGIIHNEFGWFKMVTATHTSSIMIENTLHYGGVAVGFLFNIEGKIIYYAGDTGLTLDMSLLEPYHIDIAILPIGGHYTMDTIDANIAIEMIKPKNVIPMHYNTFDLIKADPYLLTNSYGKVTVLDIDSRILL